MWYLRSQVNLGETIDIHALIQSTGTLPVLIAATLGEPKAGQQGRKKIYNRVYSF